MTVADVKEMLKEIRKKVKEGDDEGAHSRQEDMYEALIEAIANGECSDSRGCCIEARKSQRIKFERRYA